MWVLIQSDWRPYEEGKLGHAERHQGCVGTEERPREDTARERPVCQGDWPPEKPTWCTYQHLDLGLTASRTGRKEMFV